VAEDHGLQAVVDQIRRVSQIMFRICMRSAIGQVLDPDPHSICGTNSGKENIGRTKRQANQTKGAGRSTKL
jgi:hypothetical protein